MVLIHLIWKTDGKFFPEVTSLVLFQKKEATWLLWPCALGSALPASADWTRVGAAVQATVGETLGDERHLSALQPAAPEWQAPPHILPCPVVWEPHGWGATIELESEEEKTDKSYKTL